MGEVATVLHEAPPATLEEQSHEHRLQFIPKDSSTAKHDITAARFFYQQCQTLGVPLTIVNDEVGFVCVSMICDVLINETLTISLRSGGKNGCNSKLILRRTCRRGCITYRVASS